MKRLQLFFILLCLYLTSFSQGNKPTVVGIEFGSTYEDVEHHLEKRYGKKSLLSTKDQIQYFNINIGGCTYIFADFYFQRDNETSAFNNAIFSSNFDLDSYDLAKIVRDYIKDNLSEKYQNIILKKDDVGNEVYLCGTNPMDKSKYLISLRLEKGKSNKGKMYWYVILNYGPIDYLGYTNDL